MKHKTKKKKGKFNKLRNVKYMQVFKRWEKGTERERETFNNFRKERKGMEYSKGKRSRRNKRESFKCETKKGKFNQVRNIIYVQVFERKE